MTVLTDLTADGPLKDLFVNKYQYKEKTYPADLGSQGKNHAVSFSIYDVKSLEVQDLGKKMQEVGTKVIENGIEKTTAKLVEGASQTLIEGQKLLTDAAADPSKTFDGIKKEIGSLLSTRKEFKTKVTLYMPDSMQFQQVANYDNIDLSSAIGSLPLGKLTRGFNAITSFLQSNDAAKLAFNKAGYAFNPQAQVLFNNIEFRSYSLSFTFTPRSAKEAEIVRDIIGTFRTYASPTIVQATAGFFFTPPSIFNVTFLSNGQENKHINKVYDSVLESVDVNYAPNGWSAHKDGAPVQTTLTLNFKEIVLVDRNMIKDEYKTA